jgi:hypothetical protein
MKPVESHRAAPAARFFLRRLNSWIPAFAGMTVLFYIVTPVKTGVQIIKKTMTLLVVDFTRP